jgi:hypothetical protein
MCFQWSREERTGVFGIPAAHNLVKNLVKFLFSILAVGEQIQYRNLRPSSLLSMASLPQ